MVLLGMQVLGAGGTLDLSRMIISMHLLFYLWKQEQEKKEEGSVFA